MNRPLVLIISPGLAADNNGNWQTARRWSQMLRGCARTRILSHWPAPNESTQGAVAMLALHARRSADSIEAWASAHPGQGLAVVLTGTDLYQDIQSDAASQRSLALAQRLVVLQDKGPQALPPQYLDKTRVMFQSTTTRKTLPKNTKFLKAVMVGHLREVKSPQTLFQAARLLLSRPDIHIDHIGVALETPMGVQARLTEADNPKYRWLGGVAHEATRWHIQRADVLVHCSRLEGGAHVVMEAVCSGTPVLASRVDGNVGMLGEDYAGYFDWGDAKGLADLLTRCRDDSPFWTDLRAQCEARSPLFQPAKEQAALIDLIKILTSKTIPKN
jgi:putative glycosyltransferase (TIGR04348 family)